MNGFALLATRVLMPSGFVADHCVIIENGMIAETMPSSACPAGLERRALDGDLVPGFIDLQVNGGGGILFNDDPTIEGLAVIGEAHRRFGTTAFLPTLISDDLDVMARSIAAVDAAIEAGMPGVIGIHLEGPFLNRDKKGIHDASKFRTLEPEALDLIASLRRGRTLVTLAPELAPPGMIKALVDRGVVVAAGHTAACYDDLQEAFGEGLSGFTHLFNAMSQLGSREPGAVGAALDSSVVWCGLIVDGHHVHPATLRIALTAKGSDCLALVTDAMPPVGSNLKQFSLGGQTIFVDGERCVNAEGRLAGSALNMAAAVRNAERLMGVDRATAVRMASTVPAGVLGLSAERGSIGPGMRADLVLLDSDGQVTQSWIAGQ